MKTFKDFLNENQINKTLSEYLKQVEFGDYIELTQKLYDFISTEGWVVSLEEEFKDDYDIDDFEYLVLNITEEDKTGLISMDEQTIEKFNEFDLELKKLGEYPYDTLDFINYDKGQVYIIRLL